jgi:4-amino-4-deoxy-L-arabinose transferase-like glycosyltransferase
MLTRHRGRSALLSIGLAILLGAWSVVIPIFEQPDEPSHWQYARYLHDHWRLPHYERGFAEANSPPLYYALAAPLAADSPVPPSAMAPTEGGGAASLAPPRRFLNADDDFTRFFRIWRVRLLSVAISIATVWLTFRIGLMLSSQRDAALLGALIAALLPQFTFRGSGISNDVLVTALSAATTHASIVLLRRGFSGSRGVWAGVLLAAAYLTKISAIALVVPVAWALVAAEAPGEPREHRTWIQRLLRTSALVPALLIVLPWTLHNVSRYGDPFASGAMHHAVAHLITERSLLSSYFVTQFPLSLGKSFIGNFGWMNVGLPGWMYALYVAVWLAAAFGLVCRWRKGQLDVRSAVALVLTFVATLAVVVYINLTFTQPQGRYLFPALPAMAALAGLGLASLPGRMAWIGRPLVLGLALSILNLYALALAGAAYHPAPTRDVAPGVRRLQATAISGLWYAPATNDFAVSGGEPAWILEPDVDAQAYGSIRLALRASLEPRAQRGCIHFATATRPLHANAPACFSWIADGSTQEIAVSLTAHPQWRGRVTQVRVNPFAEGDSGSRGARIALERVELRR